MRKTYYRLKTLYWFWKQTRHLVDKDKWIMESGFNEFGNKTLELWTPEKWTRFNK